MPNEPEIMGVYSHSTKYQYQVGERVARYRHGTYWYVRKLSQEEYEVQPLNASHVPSGMRKVVPREEFVQFYTPELDYYRKNTLPCLETLERKIKMGRRYFNVGKLDKAEESFCQAVMIHDENVEANMGLGRVYAHQQEFTKLRVVLDKLLANDETFMEEQRHHFNEFGIDLRKKALYDDAIRFYSKALQVNDQDENLHFNIARAYYERGKIDQCREHLCQARELNPVFEAAILFLRMLDIKARKQGES